MIFPSFMNSIPTSNVDFSLEYIPGILIPFILMFQAFHLDKSFNQIGMNTLMKNIKIVPVCVIKEGVNY